MWDTIESWKSEDERFSQNSLEQDLSDLIQNKTDEKELFHDMPVDLQSFHPKSLFLMRLSPRSRNKSNPSVQSTIFNSMSSLWNSITNISNKNKSNKSTIQHNYRQVSTTTSSPHAHEHRTTNKRNSLISMNQTNKTHQSIDTTMENSESELDDSDFPEATNLIDTLSKISTFRFILLHFFHHSAPS